MLSGRGFNRTKVGLKLGTFALGMIVGAGFNRTKVGLKLRNGPHVKELVLHVLIEPKWD